MYSVLEFEKYVTPVPVLFSQMPSRILVELRGMQAAQEISKFKHIHFDNSLAILGPTEHW